MRAVVNGLKLHQSKIHADKDVLGVDSTLISSLLDDALQRDVPHTDRTAVERYRADAAVVVDFLHFNRGDTGVRLRADDLVAFRDTILMRKRKLKAGTGVAMNRVNRVPIDAVDGFALLLAKWTLLRNALGLLTGGAAYDDTGMSSLWRLPWERASTSATWKQSKMTDFLNLSLTYAGITAPDGYKYTYHSLRHGSATAAHAIYVPERRIRTMGNWSGGTSKGGQDAIDGYIDELKPATAADYRCFGWLAPAPPPHLRYTCKWTAAAATPQSPTVVDTVLGEMTRSYQRASRNTALVSSTVLSTPGSTDTEPATDWSP